MISIAIFCITSLLWLLVVTSIMSQCHDSGVTDSTRTNNYIIDTFTYTDAALLADNLKFGYDSKRKNALYRQTLAAIRKLDDYDFVPLIKLQAPITYGKDINSVKSIMCKVSSTQNV